MKTIRIAIDGPSGSGKSTIGRKLAAYLGYIYIDTGAMYRAVALKAQQQGLDLEDEAAVVAMAEKLSLQFRQTEHGQRLLVNGEDLTDAVRTPAVAQGASRVSAFPGVRRILVRRQQEMGAEGRIVMDGRDIGTVVFPTAEIKIYLDASVQERARRRVQDDRERGLNTNLDETEQAIRERDARDMNRSDSPLRQAGDAVFIDSTRRSIEEVFRTLLQIIEEKTGQHVHRTD